MCEEKEEGWKKIHAAESQVFNPQLMVNQPYKLSGIRIFFF